MTKEEVSSAILNRWAVKSYDTTKRLKKDEVDILKQSFRYSPSSINLQPWKLLIISKKQLKESLASSILLSNNRNIILTCSHLAIFLCRKKIDKEYINDVFRIVKEKKNLSEESINKHTTYYWPFVSERVNISSWLEKQVYLNVGYTIANLSMAGIGTTPLEGLDLDAFDNILGLTRSKYRTLIALAIGFSDSEKDYSHINKIAKSRFETCDIIEEID